MEIQSLECKLKIREQQKAIHSSHHNIFVFNISINAINVRAPKFIVFSVVVAGDVIVSVVVVQLYMLTVSHIFYQFDLC